MLMKCLVFVKYTGFRVRVFTLRMKPSLPAYGGEERHAVRAFIGDEPNNSTKCSEVADGVARQSEGIAQVSLLSPVR
jgi:hypothetical protein